MFENLSQRLSGVFDKLTKQGALSEDNVKTALREVRVAFRRVNDGSRPAGQPASHRASQTGSQPAASH